MSGNDRPDIEVGARVKAKRFRFERKPRASGEFTGDPEPETESDSDRKNLPDEIEPGKTYRDVELWWRAAARMEWRRRPMRDRR